MICVYRYMPILVSKPVETPEDKTCQNPFFALDLRVGRVWHKHLNMIHSGPFSIVVQI
jgi:hypothetical protein